MSHPFDGAPASGESNQITNLLWDLRRKRSELDDQRRELSVLIKQASSEIERLSGRAREASSQLRQVESNLSSFTQADIKRAYSAAQEAQMRQFMMQNQLEQLRNRHSSLDASDDLLKQLIDSADVLSEASGGDSSGVASSNRLRSDTEQMLPSHESADMVFRGIELVHARLSHKLQEETGQILSDLILRAEVCERLVEMDRQKAKTEIGRLKQAASSALKSTRQYVHELRSPALEEAGLSAALRRYVEVTKAPDKTQVDLQIAGLELPLSQAVGTAVFRIVQEALSNATRHSGSSRADVRVRYDSEQMTVIVADDGQGFDVEQALQQAWTRDQAGLTDMQLRAELIGATLEISSKPGNGCMVSLNVPV